MSYVTLEVNIESGRIVPREPEKLPEKGSGLLTLLPNSTVSAGGGVKPQRQRVELPLIRGDGKQIVDPSAEELDASLWVD